MDELNNKNFQSSRATIDSSSSSFAEDKTGKNNTLPNKYFPLK